MCRCVGMRTYNNVIAPPKAWRNYGATAKTRDRRPLGLPGPGGDLPRHASQRAHRTQNPDWLRAEDLRRRRCAARRAAAPRKSVFLAAAFWDAPILARFCIAGGLVALGAPYPVVAELSARQRRHGILARNLHAPRRHGGGLY